MVHGRATFHELGSKHNGGAVCTIGGGTFVAHGGITATNNYAVRSNREVVERGSKPPTDPGRQKHTLRR